MKNNKKVISSKGKKKTKNHTVSTSAKDKVKAAKARLKQMQKSGALQAPPRRAASLTAAAMVHFMYDNEQVPAKPGNLNNAKNTASPGPHKEIGPKCFPQFQLDFHMKTDPGPSWVSNIS